MTNSKISRSTNSQINQTDLVTNTDKVFKQTNGTDANPSVKYYRINELEKAIQEFEDAIVAARNKGLTEILAKKAAQKKLIKLLERLNVKLVKQTALLSSNSRL